MIDLRHKAGLVALLASICTNGLFAQTAVPATVAVEGQGVYNEGYCYSAYTRPSYVPAYIPKISSLYENPRTFPTTLGPILNPYYQYQAMNGWFFCSPNGYQSSVPKDSQALAYNQGELGITAQLDHGYPMGQRVIEQVVIPVNSSCRRAGYFISSGHAFVATASAEMSDVPSSQIRSVK